MDRRQFIKRTTMAAAAVALLPAHLPAQTADGEQQKLSSEEL